jgi:alkylation response protein AidB-like acyl-CoA dehydrogenase
VDFDLNADQAVLQDAVAQIAAKHRAAPVTGEPVFHSHDPALEAELAEAGFFDILRQEDYGPLDAALAVEAIAKLPRAAEVGASMLVAPQLVDEALPRPIALLDRPGAVAVRFLPVAKTALIDAGDDVLVLDLQGTARAPTEGLYAYPFGRFTRPPELAKARRLGAAAVPRLRQWWRVALAVEASGALQAALDFTAEYVRDRRAFNRPLGALQAIQHRLAHGASAIQGLRWLALSAAWSGDPAEAALAATYAQETAAAVIYDLHQFNGALGLTLEHPLHFWTYRLKALQAELGAVHGQAAAAADLVWGNA